MSLSFLLLLVIYVFDVVVVVVVAYPGVVAFFDVAVLHSCLCVILAVACDDISH